MAPNSFDAKEQVRQAVDIVDLVGHYLPLRREGRAYKALCPWHDDSRPSLTVNPDRQSFKCWVCDIGGDVFSFVMKYEGVSFAEALAMLAERAGIVLPKHGLAGNPDELEVKRTLYQAMAWAEQQYHDALFTAEGDKARNYLTERGISEASVRRFRLGVAPDSWDWIQQHARQTRFSSQLLEQVGLIGQRRSGNGYYDRFKGRVLFSIHDPQARPVGLGGRVLPGTDDPNAAKYVNSPETPLFSKSGLLYGLDLAKDTLSKSGTALVMEGYTDVIIAHQFGFTNAVAVLGTALGERHIRLLRRFVDRIVLILDGDEAGRRRTDEVLELFVAADMDLRILTLPDELDPADYLLQHGSAAFEEQLTGAVDALEHKFRTLTHELGDDLHAVNRAVEQILATLAKAPRPQGLASSAVQLKEAQILTRLSRRAGVSEEILRRRLNEQRRSSSRPRGTEPDAPVPVKVEARRETAERWLLEILLTWPEFLPQAREQLSADQLVCPRRRVLFARSCALADEGHPPTFARLMLEFDDPDMKSLLVDLDEEHRAINRSSAEQELRDLLDSLVQQSVSLPLRRADTSLESPATPSDLLLRQAIERERSRQGISLPTDG